ncbi:MAG TPA: peptide chain release factor N(5)-glutamine methyltransferase [Burkholderiales bacterium]|nr:peptide chain release factor N(5)-glutamine methyltransferase [Burkholderiales bacterium]
MPADRTVAALLEGAGFDAREARLLLAAATGVGTALLVAFPEREVEAAASRRYLDMAQRRRAGEPVAYILGSREFYGREFSVTPAVLIPRPETELLVDLGLARIDRTASAVAVLDLGTGSGVVALTIACEAQNAHVTAVDVSPAALTVARGNLERLALPRSPRLLQSDWFASLGDARFDLIVGNPPYVAEGDAHLARGDLRFEPRGALAAGAAGLDAITKITSQAPRYLAPGAWLLLEHGYDQGSACRALLTAAGLREVQTWPDLAGLDRVSGGVAPRA